MFITKFVHYSIYGLPESSHCRYYLPSHIKLKYESQKSIIQSSGLNDSGTKFVIKCNLFNTRSQQNTQRSTTEPIAEQLLKT